MEKYRSIFKELIKKWPPTLSVSEKIVFGNGHFRIPSLVQTHDNISKILIETEKDMDVFQVDWAIYTVLHTLARNIDTLNIDSLTFEMIEKVLIDNINHK